MIKLVLNRVLLRKLSEMDRFHVEKSHSYSHTRTWTHARARPHMLSLSLSLSFSLTPSVRPSVCLPIWDGNNISFILINYSNTRTIPITYRGYY